MLDWATSEGFLGRWIRVRQAELSSSQVLKIKRQIQVSPSSTYFHFSRPMRHQLFCVSALLFADVGAFAAPADSGGRAEAYVDKTAEQPNSQSKSTTRTEVSAQWRAAIKVAKDFKIELLYTVPRETQGSWVSMCVDGKGRLIVSDQNGALYRVTLPRANAEAAKVEKVNVNVGFAHGLLWAFDSLYVAVNEGKLAHGVYRVRDTDGDDQLDKVELLRQVSGR